ncbi:MAG TPA: DNA repair protein RadA [Candidatus Babeliales bacterium]|nr:DNA repair protein RadA [Candidatus Babeliales bacterium]
MLKLMNRTKNSFICSQCNYTTIKWIGCCPECKQWDCMVENIAPINTTTKMYAHSKPVSLVSLHEIDIKEQPRLLSGIEEWDRVVGGGIVPGSLIVITGDPGIGKSTLLLQVAYKIAKTKHVFYFSTEESLQQLKGRATRLNTATSNLLFSDAAELTSIIITARENKPDLLVIDSIQNCYINDATTLPGSVGQLREAAFQLMRLSKEHNITIIITGHITKEGIIAGPKTLEHMVDAVFYLQGEDRWQTRMLRAVKNRFGAVNELGFFCMEHDGLKEVPNINAHLISEISHAPGSTIVSIMEGSRPILLELQALTNASKLTMPQRVVSGLDHKQVVLIAAILEKYLKIKLSMHDIFFKVSGGFKIKGNESDLGTAFALLSSYFQEPLPENSIALGEISLTGQIKPINNIGHLVKEAEKFGITTLLIAQNQTVEKTSCIIKKFNNVYELLSLFGNGN